MAPLVTQDGINRANLAFCQPMMVILNFSLFQYLLTVFLPRRHEFRVRVLLLTALISFAALVPFSYPDAHLTRNLNDISEVCSVLAFTQQIAMLTRDINKKMKLPVIRRLGKIAKLLVFVGLGVLIGNVVHIATPEAAALDTVELVDMVAEYIALSFVVGFRFYFLGAVRGWAHIWQQQKREVAFYLLLLTHAVPFKVLTSTTGLDWHHIQGFWLRFTIALCLSLTIRAKLISMSSLHGSKTTGRQQSTSRQTPITSVVPSDTCVGVSRSDRRHVNTTPGPVLDKAGSSKKKTTEQRSGSTADPNQHESHTLAARMKRRGAVRPAGDQPLISTSEPLGPTKLSLSTMPTR